MIKHGLKASTLTNGPQTTEEYATLQNAVHDMASQAHAHLDEARKLNDSDLSSLSHNALYPAVSCSLYLDRLATNDFDPFFAAKKGNESYHSVKLNMHLLKSSFTRGF